MPIVTLIEQHKPCHGPTTSLCVWSEALGLYKSYKRQAKHCVYCSPDRMREIAAAERADKENRLSSTAESNSSQDPPSPHSLATVDISLICATDLCLVSHCAYQRSSRAVGKLVDGQGCAAYLHGLVSGRGGAGVSRARERMLGLAAQPRANGDNTYTLTSQSPRYHATLASPEAPYKKMVGLYAHGIHFWHVTVRKFIDFSTSVSTAASSLLLHPMRLVPASSPM